MSAAVLGLVVVIASVCLAFVTMSPNVTFQTDVVAVIGEDQSSMPANLKLLGVKFDTYQQPSLQSLDLRRYRIIIVDYSTGIRGQEKKPTFDITDWAQEKQGELIQWIRDGGTLIQFSQGEGFVLGNLTLQSTLDPEPLRGIQKNDSLFTTPHILNDTVLTSVASADTFIVGGSDLGSFNLVANGTKGPVLITRNLDKGKMLFCCIKQEGSVFRRGMVENILQWAANGSLACTPFAPVELSVNHISLRYPSFASSVPALSSRLDLAAEKLCELGSINTTGIGKITFDFTKDLEWDFRVSASVLTRNETYVDIWQLPELTGNEESLECTLFRELGRVVLGQKTFLDSPFNESFSQLGSLYCLDTPGDGKLYNTQANECTSEFSKYLEEGANFTRLSSSALTGMLLNLKERYGWTMFKEYYSLVDSSTDFGKLSLGEKLSVFSQYISVASGHNLFPDFQKWGLPVQPLSEIDRGPPVISVELPQNGGVTGSKPRIEANFHDDIAVNASTITLALDQEDLTSDALITSRSLTYTPEVEVPEGDHELTITATDLAGNTGTWKGCFTVSRVRSLSVLSEFGTVYGAGLYNTSSSATFNVSETTVSTEPGVRFRFSGWNSTDRGGYIGAENPARVTMETNITEVAQWTRQYYVVTQTDMGGKVYPGSGWSDAGLTVNLTATANQGFVFGSWLGNGTGSYTGSDLNQSLVISAAMGETASFLDVQPPSVVMGLNQTVKVGENVAFDGSRSTDNSAIVSYKWDFGDGSQSFLPLATHSYKKSGIYNVTLTVSDRGGNSAADTARITVTESTGQVEGKWDFTTWISENWMWIFLIASLAIVIGLMPYLLTKAT